MSSISSFSTAMPQRPDPAEFFKKADTDGSGGISKTELAEMLKNAPKPQGSSDAQAPNVDEIFSQVDTDGDGEISEAENKTHMEEMAKNGPKAPMEMSGSSQAFDQFVEALKSSDISEDELNSLLKDWVAQLKEKGSSTTLFSTQA